ncbi:MAG TPA: hypothetical protein VN625_01585 [Desulfuromonadaceae bacterium]|nr:hypothetical protein [Desulfuromonadaceae bacterium]
MQTKFHLLVFSFLFSVATFAADTNTYRSIGNYITGASDVLPMSGVALSPLEFNSSDKHFTAAFHWAKAQAMAYVFDGDPVGPWYEAAEPGREAFCMRDTAHQAMGAHALGLDRYNLNMLRRFAENISDARDWCSLWEIDRFNRPAPVDYKNDNEFWFNLPANFDILDCCYRMYVWSGDTHYIGDPAFLNFYDHTVTDYVDRWQLGVDQAMKRPRLLNNHVDFEHSKKFAKNRGIPGYDEQEHTYFLGFDVLATERAAFLAYAHLQQARFNEELSSNYLQKAAAVENLLTNTWWNPTSQCFYARLNKDYQLEGRARRDDLNWNVITHVPNADAFYQRLIDAAFSTQSRREYPEIPFTWIGDLVNGTMGINLIYTSPLESATKGNWVEIMVQTQPALASDVSWAELRNLPMRANQIAVRHDGNRKTKFTNQRGPALVWQATFDGSHSNLLVNGKTMKALVDMNAINLVSSVKVIVGAGGTATVEVPK